MKQEMQGCLPGRTRIVSFMIALAALLALGSCKPRVKSAGCDIISFTVDSVEWIIDGDNITRVYPEGTAPLTPSITLSPGATITPAPDAPRDFFTGVSYTVTAENDTTTRTYAAKAATSMTGVTGECTWTLAGKPGNYTLVISGNGAMADYDLEAAPPWRQYGEEINALVIEDGVTTIGGTTFVGYALTGTLIFPNSVTSIGECAFRACYNLTSVSIPNSVTSIGERAFRACYNLTSVSIPNSVTEIGYEAFWDCEGLISVSIPNSVTRIGYETFKWCRSLTSVVIPESVTEIGDEAFAYCSSLTSVTIPGSVTEIGTRVFEGCSSLTSVTIPGSVTSIGYGAFWDCEGLTSVVIPESVTEICYGAFWGCKGLTSVTNHSATPQDISEGMFEDMSSATLRVPSSAVEAYKNAGGWKDFGTIIGM